MPYAQTVNVGGASHNAMSKSVALIPHLRGVLLGVAASLSGWNLWPRRGVSPSLR